MEEWLDEVQTVSGVEKKPAETVSEYLRRVADVNDINEALSSEVIESYNRHIFSEGASLTPTDSPFTDFLDEIDSKPESKNDESTTSESQLGSSSSAPSSTDAPTAAENEDSVKRSTPDGSPSQPPSSSSKRSKLVSQVQQRLNEYSNTPSFQTSENIQSTWLALVLFVLVVIAAFVVRTQIIGDYPLHGDEAINIMHIRDLREAGRVWYRPFVHGISVYYGAFLTYPLHTSFSSQLIWARWIPASIWLIGIGSLWFIRDEISDLPLLTGVAVLGFIDLPSVPRHYSGRTQYCRHFLY